jgi:Uma2 family endonuclease
MDSGLVLPIPAGPYTADDLEKLPGGDVRYELDEGKLIVAAAAMRPWHGWTEMRIATKLAAQGRHAYIELGVRLDGHNARSCDVAVLNEPATEAAYYPPSAFALVVEVVSDYSKREDYETKPQLYAEAGIPRYWIVDRHADDADDGLIYMHELTRGGGGPRYTETLQTTLSKWLATD